MITFSLCILSFLAGIVVSCLLYPSSKKITVTWKGSESNPLFIKRNLLMSMQDELIRGGFVSHKKKGNLWEGTINVIRNSNVKPIKAK